MRTENQKLARLFYVFAALQAPIILVGAVVGLFMAPVSLFVSTTESQYIGWLLIALIALANLALGLLVLPLAIAAGVGLHKEKRWGKIVGIIAALLALLQFPVGSIFGGYLFWKILKQRKAEEIQSENAELITNG
jgi:glycerol-3-phosphate acyltransferase PlsY